MKKMIGREFKMAIMLPGNSGSRRARPRWEGISITDIDS